MPPYAERKKKFINKLKEQGTFYEYKKKRAKLEKERRIRVKQAMEKMSEVKRNQVIVENRIKNRKGVQKFRERQKELKASIGISEDRIGIREKQQLHETLTQNSQVQTLPAPSTENLTNQPTNQPYILPQISASVNFPNSYKTKSALGKAVAKTKKALPSSPSKRKAVVAKLLRTFDAKDQQDILGNKMSEKKKTGKRLSPVLLNDITIFFERDDVSRISPNVKDLRKFVNVITGEKEAKQIRHLKYKLSEVYNMFIDENKENNESSQPPVKLSKFCALRPKHVFLMAETPRNVCFCIYHSNFIQCATSLHKYMPEVPQYGPDLIELLVCENPTRECYFKTCNECASSKIDKKIRLMVKASVNKTKTVEWLQWIKDEEENRCQNVKQIESSKKFIDYFLSIYPTFLKHSYIKREQEKAFNADQKRVSSGKHLDEAVLQIDFAENFKCECQDEAYQAHYNTRQISLFTTALHHTNQTYSKVISSDNLHHTKETIPAYLFTILKDLPSTIKTVKVWSDGPRPQFKNKFIASIIPIFELKFKIKIIWNFFATAHGKSCVDGIGASVKHKVKISILSRESIVNKTQDFVSAFNLKKSNVKVIELTPIDIDKMNVQLKLSDLFAKAPAVRNISTFHQLKFLNNKITGFITSGDGYKV